MRKSKPAFLWGLLLLQLICTVFFAGDVLRDLFSAQGIGTERGDILEAGVTLCLLLGTLFSGWELRKSLLRETRMKRQLDIASGAFADMLERQFDAWELTKAERSVALLGIKGYSIAEIAALRDTKEGTIKAQNAAVYRKAGVTGRLQLLSHFVEDLMDDSLISPAITKPQA